MNWNKMSIKMEKKNVDKEADDGEAEKEKSFRV